MDALEEKDLAREKAVVESASQAAQSTVRGVSDTPGSMERIEEKLDLILAALNGKED